MSSNNGQQPRILVADDSEANRYLLEGWLRELNYEVICSADGGSALEVLQTGSIDLALLDVVMPGLTGYAVCREVKANPLTRLTPVVLVTGLANTEDRVQGIECGADDFISKPVRKEELLARVRSLVRLKLYTDELETAETVLCSLAKSIEAKDPYTQGHCDRLSEYSVALARKLNLPEEQITALRRAGIVHDIGKVVVPESILLKPGPLTPDERAVMEKHPVVGESICAPLRSFRLVLPIIRHHHEKQDGSGYPDGLSGEAIPLSARILQTVDIYDALTTERPYRRALTNAEAFEILNKEVQRGWWDARLMKTFEIMVSDAAVPQVTRGA